MAIRQPSTTIRNARTIGFPRRPTTDDRRRTTGDCYLIFLAFPGRDREKRRRFLFDVFAPAVRALECFVIVLVQGQNFLKGLLAVMANIIVNRHDVLQGERSESLPYLRIVVLAVSFCWRGKLFLNRDACPSSARFDYGRMEIYSRSASHS